MMTSDDIGAYLRLVESNGVGSNKCSNIGLESFLTILGSNRETTPKTIKCSDIVTFSVTSGSFLVVEVLDLGQLTVGFWDETSLITWVDHWMLCHLLATSSDREHLSELCTLFDEAIKLITQALHNVTSFIEITSLLVRIPLIDQSVVSGGVAVSSVTSMSVWCLVRWLSKALGSARTIWWTGTNKTLWSIWNHWSEFLKIGIIVVGTKTIIVGGILSQSYWNQPK